jgi:hypothetical protein
VKRKVLLLAAAAASIAMLAQALWETPLGGLVWHITYIGTRAAWVICTPDYSNNASVWAFDLIAAAINALVYFSILFAAAQIFSTLRMVRRPTV